MEKIESNRMLTEAKKNIFTITVSRWFRLLRSLNPD